MGWQDRSYAPEDEYRRSMQPKMRMRFGSGFSPAVKWLLIVNVAVFVVDLLILKRQDIDLARWAGLNWTRAVAGLQFWRFATYMFVHGGMWHIAMNMLMLYFFGPTLERKMGTSKFLWFYFGCGLTGGAAFLTYGWSVDQSWMNVIGASGATLGVLIGYAILFPHARLIFILFPIKARTLAIGYAAISVLYVLADPNEGGGVAHAAHLGGIVFAVFWFLVLPRWQGKAVEVRQKSQQGAWDRKLEQEADEQVRIDEILEKIKAHGLDSLTRAEKRRLKDATRRQQEETTRRKAQNKRTNM